MTILKIFHPFFLLTLDLKRHCAKNMQNIGKIAERLYFMTSIKSSTVLGLILLNKVIIIVVLPSYS